jgi:hypothetical protein
MEKLLETPTGVTSDSDSNKKDFADTNHADLLEDITSSDHITREQFAYLLNLLTQDINVVRDASCGFKDYEKSSSLLGLAAVNDLCYKGIVRGTRETKFYYDAHLTQAEAVTMVIRALYPDDYQTLIAQEQQAAQGMRYTPYYALANKHNILVDGLWKYGTTKTISPSSAIKLLEKNFDSIQLAAQQAHVSMIYDHIANEDHAHVVRWVRDIHGADIAIDEDSIKLSLDPYWSIQDKDDMLISRSCE